MGKKNFEKDMAQPIIVLFICWYRNLHQWWISTCEKKKGHKILQNEQYWTMVWCWAKFTSCSSLNQASEIAQSIENEFGFSSVTFLRPQLKDYIGQTLRNRSLHDLSTLEPLLDFPPSLPIQAMTVKVTIQSGHQCTQLLDDSNLVSDK